MYPFLTYLFPSFLLLDLFSFMLLHFMHDFDFLFINSPQAQLDLYDLSLQLGHILCLLDGLNSLSHLLHILILISIKSIGGAARGRTAVLKTSNNISYDHLHRMTSLKSCRLGTQHTRLGAMTEVGALHQDAFRLTQTVPVKPGATLYSHSVAR